MDQNPKEYFDKIVDTEPKNRTWVLSVVLNFVFAAAAITCYFVFSARENKAISATIKAERKLDLCRDNILKENKDYTKALELAIRQRDEYWSVKFDNIQSVYNKDLKERADNLEKQVRLINKRVKR